METNDKIKMSIGIVLISLGALGFFLMNKCGMF